LESKSKTKKERVFGSTSNFEIQWDRYIVWLSPA
jgi:hypothetical protein